MELICFLSILHYYIRLLKLKRVGSYNTLCKGYYKLKEHMKNGLLVGLQLRLRLGCCLCLQLHFPSLSLPSDIPIICYLSLAVWIWLSGCQTGHLAWRHLLLPGVRQLSWVAFGIWVNLYRVSNSLAQLSLCVVNGFIHDADIDATFVALQNFLYNRIIV